MKLYDFPFSPNCRKVRAVAYELEIAFETCPVSLPRGEQNEAPFKAINPNGRVPVLVDGDFVLWESNAICRYLAETRAQLLPMTAQGRAEMDRWLCWQLSHLAPAIRKVAFERVVKKLSGGGEPDARLVAEGTKEFAAMTAILEDGLGTKEYLAGTLSVADFVLAAHCSLAAMCGLSLAEAPRVKAWLDRMVARPSMKRALADAHAENP